MSNIAVVVTPGSVQDSKIWWVQSGDSVHQGEAISASEAAYIALPKELVKEVTAGTIEEPYIYWQPNQQEVSNGNSGDVALHEAQFVDATAFSEAEILCDEMPQPEWNDDLTTLLIQTRLGMAKEFSEPKCTKCKLWKRIAAKMNSVRGGDTSLIGPDCDRKWRNLVQTFKAIRERMERTGRSSVTWKFYTNMAEAMKDRTEDEDGLVDNSTMNAEWTGGLEGETCDEMVDADEGESSQLVWTDDLIRMLIENRSAMMRQFSEHIGSASKLWRRVALKINQIRGEECPVLAGPDCDRKWRNLLQTFNSVRMRESCSGQNTVNWKFYSMMLDAVKDNPDGESDVMNRNGHKQTMWTQNLIRLLIETRSSMTKLFETPKCSKSKLWRGIASKLNSLRSDSFPAFTGPDCDRKWRNLVQTFKTIRDRRQRTGRAGVNWKYYSLMLEALNDGESMEPSTSTGRSIGRFRKRNSDNSDEAPDWFTRYVEERRVVEDQRWEELKQMETAKLEAIRALTDTIKQHMCKCGKTES